MKLFIFMCHLLSWRRDWRCCWTRSRIWYFKGYSLIFIYWYITPRHLTCSISMFESQTKTLEWSSHPYLKSSIATWWIEHLDPCQTNISRKLCTPASFPTFCVKSSWRRHGRVHPINLHRPYFRDIPVSTLSAASYLSATPSPMESEGDDHLRQQIRSCFKSNHQFLQIGSLKRLSQFWSFWAL